MYRTEHYRSTFYTIELLQLYAIKIVHTICIIVFKEYDDAVNIERATKIYFPPRAMEMRCGFSNVICPHTGSCISINCVICCEQI